LERVPPWEKNETTQVALSVAARLVASGTAKYEEKKSAPPVPPTQKPIQSARPSEMEFFESDVPQGDGLCSDNSCPCNDTVIRRGTGYLFIEEEIVEFRRKYRGMQDAINAKEVAARARGNALGFQRYIEHGRIGPVLVCERGARLRELDLSVAAADAAHWWQTGLVPLRATPKQGRGRANVPQKPDEPAPKAGPPPAFVVAAQAVNALVKVTNDIQRLPTFKKDEAAQMAEALEPILAVVYKQLDDMEAQGVDAEEIRALRALALFREAGVASAVGSKIWPSEGHAIWYDRAIDLYGKSNDLIPTAEAYLLMGSLLQSRDRADEALAAFQEAERRGTGDVKRGATEAISEFAAKR